MNAPSCKGRRTDRAVPYASPALTGGGVINASYRRQRFAAHSHPTYAIGLITSGALAFRCERHRWVAPRGTICLVNAGDVHTGEPGALEGWSYWNAYVPPEVLTGIATQLGIRAAAIGFKANVVEDSDVSAALLSFFDAVRAGADLIAQEMLLHGALALLLTRFVGLSQIPRAQMEPRLVRRAKEYMADRFAEPLRLDEIAAHVGITQFHLIRLFKAATGLSVHAWLVQHRIERARDMLLHGTEASEAAYGCGFSDQPHLTRWLRRMAGVTPGDLQDMSRIFKTDKRILG